jgi:hypothetical protein
MLGFFHLDATEHPLLPSGRERKLWHEAEYSSLPGTSPLFSYLVPFRKISSRFKNSKIFTLTFISDGSSLLLNVLMKIFYIFGGFL